MLSEAAVAKGTKRKRLLYDLCDPVVTPSLSNIYKNNYFEYSNYGSPFQFIGGNHLGFQDDTTYIADGRILKQYSVTEHHPEEVERNRLLQSNEYRSSQSFFDGSFQPILNQFDYSPYPSATIGFNPRFGLPLDSHHHSPLLTRNHGPVALGSGSIGYIHGPNGVAIGSGSLGYISHKQHRESLQELVLRKAGSTDQDRCTLAITMIENRFLN